jgi:cytochrome b561
LATATSASSGGSAAGTEAVRYDTATITLHWVVAGLVAVLWGMGTAIDIFPRSWHPPMWSLHILLGLLLLLALAVRLGWRIFAGRRLPPSSAGLLGKIASGIHQLLYLLLGSVLIVGLVTAWLKGSAVFELFSFAAPTFADRQMGNSARGVHGLIANWLLILAGLHAGAALFHHYVWRDGVLRRMWPRANGTVRGHRLSAGCCGQPPRAAGRGDLGARTSTPDIPRVAR